MLNQLRSPSLAALFAGGLMLSTPAQAAGVSFLGFGVEVDVETLAVLSQLAIMTEQAVSLYDKTQEGVRATEATLQAIRDANEAVKSSIFFIQNPDEVLEGARRDFVTSFRELDGINREAASLHASLTSAPTGFDPGAYRRAMDSGINAGNAYQTFLAFREKDYGNLGVESMRTIAGMEVIINDNDQIRQDLEKRSDLSQKDAAAISAKAHVDTSVATAMSARQLTEISRMMQVQFLDAQAARAAEDTHRAQAIQDAANIDRPIVLPVSGGDDLATNGVR